MIRIEHSLAIDRPVEEVFAFVTNVENAPLWQAWAEEARVTSGGPPGVGTKYTYVCRILGHRISSAGKFTAYEPNKRYGWKVTSGPIAGEADYVFESFNGGTRVTVRGQAEPGGFFKLAEPIVGRMVKRLFEADAENLKDLLEAGADDSA